MTKRSKQSYQEAGRRGGLSRSPRKLAASSANNAAIGCAPA